MKKKALIGFVTAAVITGLVLFVLAPYYGLLNPMSGIWRGLLYADLPKEAEIRLDGLESQVSVCRDSYGVPHIYAENEDDLFYVFGYVQAQDRLFQMDFQRRLAEGKLAEVVGQSLYETDLFFRTIGLERAAYSSYLALLSQGDLGLVKAFESFTKGVNRAIEETKATGQLPIEFKILGYEPQPWTSVDSLAIGRFISWGLSGNFYDLEFMKAYEAFGNLADDLTPFRSPYETCIYSGNFTPVDPLGLTYTETQAPLNGKKGNLIKAVDSILKWKQESERWISPVREAFASNNWVVNGSLTTTGKPILCNDPHLQLMAPPVWYEAQLVVGNATEVSMNVRGVTFPGIPVIIIGHNQYLAWGVTNVGADVIDFYRYVWSADGSAYQYLNTWENVTKLQETIKVKVGSNVEERAVYINMTRHGPILERYDEKFAMKWIGQYPTFEASAMYKFNLARNITEFKEGLGDFKVPAQNVVYADIYGNIAWWANGRYPIRKNVSNANAYLEYRLPFNGSQARGEWGDWNNASDWIDPPEGVPHIINPKEGHVATANNCPIAQENYPHWLGWIWAENYRATRITDLLREFKPLDMEDMKKIQTDMYYIPAQELVPYVSAACLGRQLTAEQERALQYLEDWNYSMNKSYIAPTIFATWEQKFRNDTFRDEYNQTGLEGRYPDTEVIQHLVEQNSTRWFDNVNTEQVETRDDMIFQTFIETVQQLRRELGDEMSQWKWGNIHKIAIDHPLGSALSWLNYPRLPAGGWENCVSPAAELQVKAGPSWRQIIDLSILSNSLCILPGGERGHAFSKHYHDQLELWLEGEYKLMTFPSKPEEQADKESIITFKPKT